VSHEASVSSHSHTFTLCEMNRALRSSQPVTMCRSMRIHYRSIYKEIRLGRATAVRRSANFVPISSDLATHLRYTTCDAALQNLQMAVGRYRYDFLNSFSVAFGWQSGSGIASGKCQGDRSGSLEYDLLHQFHQIRGNNRSIRYRLASP
jgi:hypothetical protein